MFGKLEKEEIEQVLNEQMFGHLGCYADDIVYLVPISYGYDGKCLYGHSGKGMKTKMMEKNPSVCFHVLQMENMGNWKSVIAWGTYSEITDKKERKKALSVLLQRHSPAIPSETLQLATEWPFIPDHPNDIKGIVFKIRLSKKTGRFERSIFYHETTGGI